MVRPDRTWSWKDEDELAEAVRLGVISPDEAQAARAEGERLTARLADIVPTGWEDWQPDPAWPAQDHSCRKAGTASSNIPSDMQVAAIWRYPVKSMLGERLTEAMLDARGLAGDRQYAVRDSNGKLGSGKSTHRFQAIDGLFRFSAAHHGRNLVLTLPDGRAVNADGPSTDAEISRFLGQDVTLVEEGQVSHFDVAPVHLITTASLRRLQELLPHEAITAERFRPNLVIEADGSHFLEDEWLGRTLILGERVQLRVTSRAERCVMTTFAQGDLGEAPAVLARIASSNDACFGVYATPIQTRRVRVGNQVRLAVKN